MRNTATILLCGLVLAIVEFGGSDAHAQELPPVFPTSPSMNMPPTVMPSAVMPTEGMPAHGMPSAEGDSELPPWAQTAPAEESRWQRLWRWCAGEFEDEPVPTRAWFKAEYIMAWIRSDRTPTLLTTGLTTDATPGALGLLYTTPIYGGTIGFDDRSGMRMTLGANLNETFSVDASWFFLDGRKPDFTTSSPGSPVIARPFFNINTGKQDSSITTYPGLLQGGAEVQSYSLLEGAELNTRAELCNTSWFRFRALAGLRWVNLREGLSITENTSVTQAGPLFGLPIGDLDQFRTRNDFFGGQLGLETEFEYLHFNINLFGKCAVGDMVQSARIQGATDLFGASLLNGGLFAVSSNIGQYSRDRFGVVPEAGCRVERSIGRHLTVFVAYSFLYLNDVARPGSMVDTSVNVNLVPASTTYGAGASPARPAFRFQDEEFWAHTFQFGMTYHW
jgi:Putative beta barrel porin-7 (BBP7)